MKQNNVQQIRQREYTFVRNIHYIALLGVMTLLLAACGGSAEPTVNGAQAPMREARPTFTPTIGAPVQPAPADNPQPATNEQPATDPQANPQPAAPSNEQPTPTADVTATTAPTTSTKVQAMIKEELVNTRTGPGLNYDLVEMVERGQSFEVVGKTADGGWWKICCVKSQQVWVVNQFVETSGDINSVAVITDLPAGGAPAAATPVPQPVAANPTPTVQSVAANPTPAPQPTATTAPPPPAPAFSFDLIAQEQFPDTNVVHIFLFVFEGASALPGYTLRVSHNGTELPTEGQISIGPTAGLTWPIPDGRQRLQNLKLEFAGQQPGGTWEAQLMLNGQAVGPVATFKLSDNEPNRELYVRYQKK